MRDFMDTLRASGIGTGGPAAMNQRDIGSITLWVLGVNLCAEAFNILTKKRICVCVVPGVIPGNLHVITQFANPLFVVQCYPVF